jgi:transposase-like protein
MPMMNDMITFTIACPHCQQTKPVVKFGKTGSGTQRALCNNCKKTFAVNPKSRAVTPEKEAAILRLLEERTTIRGVRRAVKCGTQIIYATLKKSRSDASV